MRRWVVRALAVLVLTMMLAWVLGHVRWPESVGLATSHLSGVLGGEGIEDTEDLFMLLCFAFSLIAATTVVVLVDRRRSRLRR